MTHDLVCPISLEKFTYPVVLSCGHTFDRDSLVKLKKTICPLCMNPFNKDNYSPNWLVIQHLGLDIHVNDTNEKPAHAWNARDAKNETMKIEIHDRTFNDILLKIKKRAMMGYPDMRYTYNTLRVTPRMINSILSKLQERGFYVRDWTDVHGCLWYGQIYILWKNA